MKIGIIGAGNIGQAVARLAVSSGHLATLSNSRDPETLRDLASKIGCGASTKEDVAVTSDLVVLTVPFTAAFRIPPVLLEGCTVVDTNNYYPDRDGRITDLDERRTTTSEMIAIHFSKAIIVKAFNAILAKDLAEPVKLASGRTRALPIAGENSGAKAIVASLQYDFGYDTVDAGSLAESWRFERAKPAYCIPYDRDALIEALASAKRDVELAEGSWRR